MLRRSSFGDCMPQLISHVAFSFQNLNTFFIINISFASLPKIISMLTCTYSAQTTCIRAVYLSYLEEQGAKQLKYFSGDITQSAD